MGMNNRMLTSIRAATIPMRDIPTILADPGMSISITPLGSVCGAGKPYDYGTPVNPKFVMCSKHAVPWKGLTEGTAEWNKKAPELVKSGLQTAKSLSRACAGVTGTAIDPKTGYTVTRKGLEQRARSPKTSR